MPITVALTDGFDDQDVELVANGVPYVVEDVATSVINGVAAELTVDGAGPITITARIVRGHGATAVPQPEDVLPDHRRDTHDLAEADDVRALATFEVPDGATLVLRYDERGIDGTVHTDPVSLGG